MRMCKIKWAEPFLEEHQDYALNDPGQYQGKWCELLQTEEIHLELGMGKGDYLLRMAEMYPECGWIGVEKDRNAAAVAARKAVDAGLDKYPNTRMIVGNAEEIGNWFAEKEVDEIHLNFSDPWPKKYTHKRRLSNERFLQLYDRILKDSGQIIMKTDNQDLFESSILYFTEFGFRITEFSVDFRRKEHPEDAITEYEQRFMDIGQPIYRVIVVKSEK